MQVSWYATYTSVFERDMLSIQSYNVSSGPWIELRRKARFGEMMPIRTKHDKAKTSRGTTCCIGQVIRLFPKRQARGYPTCPPEKPRSITCSTFPKRKP